MWGELANAGLTIGSMIYGKNEAENAAARAATASQKAAALQQEGLSAGIKELESGRGRATNYLGLYDPFISSGADSTNLLRQALGLDGAGSQKTFYDNFQNDPGYQATLKGGTNAVETSQAGGGMLRSGGTLKALMDYGARLQGGIFNNRLAQLAGLSSSGQQAAGAKAGLGAGIETGTSSKIADFQKMIGDAWGGATINSSNADQRATQNVLQLLGYGMGSLKPQVTAMGNDMSKYFSGSGGAGGGMPGGFGGGSLAAMGAI
jgi:hypothetical protein